MTQNILNLIVNNQLEVLRKECSTLEFKAIFTKQNIVKYLKTMAGFANNKGGYIVFGISDRPRKAVGVNRLVLESEFKAEEFTQELNNSFDPEINWDHEVLELGSCTFFIIKVLESMNKPIICKKTRSLPDGKTGILESHIYYRYYAQTKDIKYSDLRIILDNQYKLEQKKWMELFQSIAQSKPQNVSILDLRNGIINTEGNRKIIIDKNLLKDITFIKEGKFDEKDGAPTLRLVGEVEGVGLLKPESSFDLSDCMTLKELGRKLNLLTDRGATHLILAVVNRFNIKGNKLYHQEKPMETKVLHYYTPECVDFLISKKLTLEQARKIYQEDKAKKT